MLSFSYSKMGMYRECPQKYKFRYIMKLPEKPKYYFAFGSALHKVMEFLYSTPAFPKLEDALTFFKQDWQSTTFEAKGYKNAAAEKEGFLEGARIIKAYYEKHKNDNLRPLSTEFKSTVNIDGLSVISIVDRIDYLGDGFVSILDYKTGKTITREPDQLLMYQKLMDNNPQLLDMVKKRDPAVKEVKIANMLYYYLPMMQEQKLDPAPQKDIDIFWAGVLRTAADITAGKFEPDPGETKCHFCDYYDLCPVWKTAPESAAFEDEAPASTDPLAGLSAKIDACGAALLQAEKLKKEIAEIMAQNNLNRHYGAAYEADYETVKMLDFKDKQKTVDYLKEQNLLPKVLAPTLSTIKKLLESGTLTPQQAAALKALARETETKKLNITKTEN